MNHDSPIPASLCPLCSRAESGLVFQLSVADAALLQANLPGWEPSAGVCPRCLELFRNAKQRLAANPAIFSDGAYRILPTPLRMGADERFTGRGVTLALLDSGFYFHPDLTQPHNRIKRYVNIAQPERQLAEEWDELKQPDDSSWHGMMTSVVAAGNGYLASPAQPKSSWSKSARPTASRTMTFGAAWNGCLKTRSVMAFAS
jgi:hypothetical protein